ncbi:MAG: response regulator [Ferruginibacter sp.]|nr:response regulator [Ferruginibacter sp.]
MKTKKRLRIILLIFLLIFMFAAFLLEKVVSNKLHILLEARLKTNENQIEKIFYIHSSSLRSYVEENSYWTELCDAVIQNDSAWIYKNMAIPLQTKSYRANYLSVTNNYGRYIFVDIFSKKNLFVNKSNADASTFIKTFNSKLTEKYCYRNNGVYFEGFVSSIVPGNDFKKITKPVGYLFVSKIIDSAYLNQLHEINTEFDYSFLPINTLTTPSNFINKKTAVLTCFKTISCLNAPPIIIKISNKRPEVLIYQTSLRFAILFFLLFLLLLFYFLYRYFSSTFLNPLEKITVALEENNPMALKNISINNTEFGKVALLIETFFYQNKKFQSEIDNRIRTEEELKWAIDKIEIATLEKLRAEQSTNAKSEFLASMSHEIRTPINGVIGVANLLKGEKLTPRQKEYVDILNYSSKHLLALVSDILDFSKIETGKIEFETTSFNLNTVCNSIYKIFEITAIDKNLNLSFIPDNSIVNSVYGDSMRLNQILTNLVGNAIKFTKEGSVTFSYKLLSKTNKNCTFRFTVTDTGIGIAENEQQKIFDGFSQANKKISSTFGGTGLGLAISKKLIELQGGKLDMKSKLGEGTTFTFYLSFENGAYETDIILPSATSILNTTNLNGLRILVAEDNNINVLVLKRFLEKWGIAYKVAQNGKLALDLLEKEPFDLILMDIHMPEMDGEEATKIIREKTNTSYNNIPIIALTANASSEMQNKLLSNGFTNYISKPFNPDILFKLLKKHYMN